MRKLSLVVLSLLSGVFAWGQQGLKEGDKAPLFSAKTDVNTTWNLADHLGKKNVVVYFYPAAMTGGCTKQACSYRDHLGDFDQAGALVVGVSGDDTEALKVFRKAHNLNFPLLSDHDGSIAAKYGVPTGAGGSITRTVDEAEFVLNRGVTAQRWTFIISRDGKIAYVNRQVDAENEYKTVLDVLSKL